MRRFVVGAALVVLVAGCGGDPKADPSPSTSSAPTVSPTPTPTPTPPVLPDAAKADTKAGAIAFVKYYVELVNSAQASGQTTALELVESSGCASCSNVRRGLDEIYSNGGHIEGGDWHAEARSAARRPDLQAWSVFADVTFGPQKVVRPSGTTSLDGGQSPMTFVVRNNQGAWSVLNWSRGS
jgi:hypothetical protein